MTEIFIKYDLTTIVNDSKGMAILIFTRETHYEAHEYCRFDKSKNKEEKFSIPYYTLENVIGYYKRMLE